MGITFEDDNRRKVLHVEDDPAVQELLAELLEGYAITQTDNLSDALTFARRAIASGSPFYLYISDGEFPALDGQYARDAGLQLYDRIRELHPSDLRYVIISSSIDLQDGCRERGIPFIDKGNVVKGLRAYLKSLE